MELPDELVGEVKIRAAITGRTVKDLVVELLREGLGMTGPTPFESRAASAFVEIGEGGLPVIRCAPNAPAKRTSVEGLLALEQQSQTEEDLKRAGIPL